MVPCWQGEYEEAMEQVAQAILLNPALAICKITEIGHVY